MAKSILNRIKGVFKKLTGSPGRTEQPVKPESGRKPVRRRTQGPSAEKQHHARKPGSSESSGEKPRRGRRRRGAGTQRDGTSPKGGGSKAPQAEAAWDPGQFDVPTEEGRVRFHDLDLHPGVMRAIHELGFRYCTPIQAGIMEHTLSGRDATGKAQTGTGKTAAFLITILTHLLRKPLDDRKPGTPRALILAPTRELVLQIEKDTKSLGKYTGQSVMAVYGGEEYGAQMKRLKEETVDIVTATPGRLLDFKRKRSIHLSKVEILVIDEADRMLDMGFIPDVRRIIESTPMKGTRQTLFFSATLTPDVNRLAASWTRDPVHIDVTPPESVTLAAIDQVVYVTTDEEKFQLLCNLIIKRKWERVMVFANRRDETRDLKDRLVSQGIGCRMLSGDVAQEKRTKTLEAFRNGRFNLLVATDVAARGLHIEGVSHVVNYSLPMDPQDYVHRIGRTGRAGASGTSVSFATETEAYGIPAIEEFIGHSLKAIHPEEDLLSPLPPPAEIPGGRKPGAAPSRRPHRRSGPRGGSGRRRTGRSSGTGASSGQS